MKVVFFGSGAFGLPTAQMLAREHELVGVVSQPDRKAGRGSKLTPTPISAWACSAGLEPMLHRPDRINEPRVVEQIRSLKAEAWVVIAYGQKLGRALLDGQFAVNLHASLLPRWRGAAPINAAILAGDAETGNSVITLADRMDAGLVLAQSRRVVDPDLTAGELHDLLAEDGPELVRQVLAAHATGHVQGTTQDDALVTQAAKLSRADAWIDLRDHADAVRRRIHGLTPWPGVSVQLGEHDVKLTRVKAIGDVGEQQVAVGTLIDVERGLFVCGSRSRLQVVELQPAGKRAMAWGEFARGYRPQAGLVMRSQERA